MTRPYHASKHMHERTDAEIPSTRIRQRPLKRRTSDPRMARGRVHMTPNSKRGPKTTAQPCASRDGRYWARTSDPQLVELVRHRRLVATRSKFIQQTGSFPLSILVAIRMPTGPISAAFVPPERVQVGSRRRRRGGG